MKRFGVTVMAVACMAASAFAAGNQPTKEKQEVTFNTTSLSKYLKLTTEQEKQVARICNYFDNQMKCVDNATDNRQQMLRNAILGNMKLMRKALDEKQYADYAKVLEATLKNKGIELE